MEVPSMTIYRFFYLNDIFPLSLHIFRLSSNVARSFNAGAIMYKWWLFSFAGGAGGMGGNLVYLIPSI